MLRPSAGYVTRPANPASPEHPQVGPRILMSAGALSPTRHGVPTVPYGVMDILRRRPPSKVFDPIVTWIAIEVAAHESVARRTHKSLQHEAMHTAGMSNPIFP